jgi:hypothetical protein
MAKKEIAHSMRLATSSQLAVQLPVMQPRFLKVAEEASSLFTPA